MNTLITRVLIVIGALFVLGAVNASIYAKERTIASGTTIYLELAPVDPRSLMQGDYMALRFRLAEEIEQARASGKIAERTRRASLDIDARGVATLRSGSGGEPAIRFKLRNEAVWLGTNAYFFEEGSAHRFEPARYGEFRLDPQSGEAVLVGLRDEALREL
jgi:uncharacterized membrane-anchored protein